MHAGLVLLQDLWLPQWFGSFAGAQAFGSHAAQAEILLWRRHYSSFCGRGRLLQVRLYPPVALCQTTPPVAPLLGWLQHSLYLLEVQDMWPGYLALPTRADSLRMLPC